MDVSGRNCRPRYGGVVAFAGSRTTRGNATRRTTRRERPDHLRAIRDFRLRDLAQRQARLARQLSAPGLTAAEKTSIERRKAYYDQLAALPEAERDAVYRAL